ncbi:hypothetical protein [Variovorax soli]|uniref:Uncharacterized protein n=1 Tax=Variovorax soli TaxID=376815 RepID=A0ABU1NM57_9BURK|nr:hypothetical protein [Variovorax soli]MDR6539115.1 hypothetical protein [Variovorax soli]
MLRKASPFVGIVVFALSLWVLHDWLRAQRHYDLLGVLSAMPAASLGWAATLTVVGYAVLSGYDLLAMRFINRRVPPGVDCSDGIHLQRPGQQLRQHADHRSRGALLDIHLGRPRGSAPLQGEVRSGLDAAVPGFAGRRRVAGDPRRCHCADGRQRGWHRLQARLSRLHEAQR